MRLSIRLCLIIDINMNFFKEDIMKKIMLRAAAVIVVIAILAAGVTSSILAYKSYKKVDKFVKSQEERIKEELEESEDTENVLIADQYQIRSTKIISDAYISGNSDDLTEEEKKTLDVAKEVLEDIVKDSMSDYEKEKAIYEWIVDNVKHDGEGGIVLNTDDVCYPLGVIEKKTAVCAGYARAYKLLCDRLGVTCICVEGQVNGEGHMVNYVKIGKKWYYTDPTWCDSGNTANYRFFLLGRETSGCTVTRSLGVATPTLSAKDYPFSRAS